MDNFKQYMELLADVEEEASKKITDGMSERFDPLYKSIAERFQKKLSKLMSELAYDMTIIDRQFEEEYSKRYKSFHPDEQTRVLSNVQLFLLMTNPALANFLRSSLTSWVTETIKTLKELDGTETKT